MAMSMYFSRVYPLFSYCIAAWGGVHVCTKRGEPFKKFHRKIVRNLFERFFSTVCCIFKSAQILKFEDIYRLKVTIYMFNTGKLGKNETLMNDLDIVESCHNYSTRMPNRLLEPFPRIVVIRIGFT